MTERSALGGGAGYSLIELTCAMALAATLVGISIPATRMRSTRFEQPLPPRYGRADRTRPTRSGQALSAFAYRFVPAGADYRFTPHADGNDNGVRTIEIADGTDLTLAAAERLADKHSGVSFGLLAGLPDLDGSRASEEGVRFGSSRILTLSPDGTATPGTLYVHGSRSQYAVRLLAPPAARGYSATTRVSAAGSAAE